MAAWQLDKIKLIFKMEKLEIQEASEIILISPMILPIKVYEALVTEMVVMKTPTVPLWQTEADLTPQDRASEEAVRT